MKILIVDVETSISNNGHFADRNNRLVMVGLKFVGEDPECLRVLDNPQIEYIQSVIDKADLVIGHNLKFDCHWLRRHGVNISNIRVFDTQIAEFLFESQQNKYPSLNDTLEKYGYPPKLDVVKTEYWDKGIDTTDIPIDILSRYLVRDLEATEQVFLKQKELFKGEHKGKYKLFQLQCEDLKVLQEMEYNGLRFNSKKAREESIKLKSQMIEIENKIKQFVGITDEVPFNLNSNDHLSAILYGGIIKWTIKVPDGVFKSGKKVGHIRYKNQETSKTFDRLVDPLGKTETAKSKKNEGEASSWSVAEDVLRQLKARGKAKEVIDAILEYSKLEKLTNTYLEGFSDLIEKKNWPEDMIHGNLNQCSVVTGRLSSTSPNTQNIDPYTKKFMESRYSNDGRRYI